MKKDKKTSFLGVRMLKSLIPSLVIAGAIMTSSAQAAEGSADKLIGFEFGVGYHLTDDSRYEGVDTNFGLVIPVGQKFDVVVYHEIGRYYGKQDGAKSNIDSDVDQLRFRVTAWENEKMAVKLLLGIGYADMTEKETSTDFSQVVADAGVNLTVLKAHSGPVKGEIAINAVYRHLKFEEQNLNLTDDLGKLGGFVIGMNAGLFF
jgi:hypothetical protein